MTMMTMDLTQPLLPAFSLSQQTNDFTALIYASQNGHEPVVEQLLAAHADVNAQTKVRGARKPSPHPGPRRGRLSHDP